MLSHLLGLVFGVAAQGEPLITTASLLREENDPTSISRQPSRRYKQLQASSYDRTQTDPSNAKTWFNNADYGQFIRTEAHGDHKEWVVMEHQGPGAITRIWTPLLADKNKMVVRFYFDGSDQPTIEENFNDFLRGKGRIKPPYAFIAWPKAGVNDGIGADMYFPIPFARACKITLSEVPFYYSFDYRTYEKDAPVITFRWNDLARLDSQPSPHVLGPFTPSRADIHKEMVVNPHLALTRTLPAGENAITGISLDIEKDSPPERLRSTIVEIEFDGERTVWCPIGEFFGCGIHLRPVADRFRSVDAEGHLRAGWSMPYKKSATINIINLSGTQVPMKLRVQTKPQAWDERSMHFHAEWHYQYPLTTQPRSDWNYLTATGDGVYVGDTLTVMNWVKEWYGEGDERTYVDGEKFPSHLGTGTEDYYGYAWGMAEHYSSAFMAMPLRDHPGQGDWRGYTTTSRIRGLDAVPFRTSLKMDMEVWHWANCNVAFSAATFWYARPGAKSNRKPEPAMALRPLPMAPPPYSIAGAVEGENLLVLAKSAGIQITTQEAGLTEGKWSGDKQLFIQATKAGNYVDFYLPIKHAGRQHVILYATKSFDYGVIQFSLDGVTGKPIDLWSAKPRASGPIDLGVFDLKGDHAVFRALVKDTNPSSTGSRYYFGLDCVSPKVLPK